MKAMQGEDVDEGCIFACVRWSLVLTLVLVASVCVSCYPF